MSIIDRIIAGESCMSEVNLHNATSLMAWMRATDAHHAPEDCKRGKDCVHAPGQATVDWAAAITNEAAHVCTCGEHGDNDPVAARAAIEVWRKRWSGDVPFPPKVTGRR